MTTTKRHQLDIKPTYTNGADISLRCRTKKEREQIRRAARGLGISLNRFILEAAVSRAAAIQLNQEGA